MRVKFIDPPSGWKFGFPKVFPEGIKNVNAWLVRNGYPQKYIDGYGDYFYCRYYEKEIPDEREYDEYGRE